MTKRPWAIAQSYRVGDSIGGDRIRTWEVDACPQHGGVKGGVTGRYLVFHIAPRHNHLAEARNSG